MTSNVFRFLLILGLVGGLASPSLAGRGQASKPASSKAAAQAKSAAMTGKATRVQKAVATAAKPFQKLVHARAKSNQVKTLAQTAEKQTADIATAKQVNNQVRVLSKKVLKSRLPKSLKAELETHMTRMATTTHDKAALEDGSFAVYGLKVSRLNLKQRYASELLQHSKLGFTHVETKSNAGYPKSVETSYAPLSLPLALRRYRMAVVTTEHVTSHYNPHGRPTTNGFAMHRLVVEGPDGEAKSFSVKAKPSEQQLKTIYRAVRKNGGIKEAIASAGLNTY